MSSPIEQERPTTVGDSPTNLLPWLAAFLAVVDAGSFTAAARRTGSDKTVVSRRVKALEQALGVRLLNRTTRSLHVTDAGRRLVDEARDPISDALTALVRTQAPERVDGTIRVASTLSLVQSVWIPVLRDLRAAHPDLRIELSGHEILRPLVEEGFDLAVRVGRLPDSGLIARRLATWRHLLVASPAWVDAHPEVRSPADLVEHWMLWGPTARAQTWSFARGDDALDVRLERFSLVVTTSQMLIEAAWAGLGVTAMPPFTVARALSEGSLVRLLPEWRVTHELGLYGVTPHRTLLPARVQVVLEAVRARIADLVPGWDAMTA